MLRMARQASAQDVQAKDDKSDGRMKWVEGRGWMSEVKSDVRVEAKYVEG